MGLIGRSIEAAANAASSITTTALTNKANKDIADQTNAEAIRQFDTNLDWLKYQYEDTKEWNSPEAVRARLVSAGYNPLWTENVGSPATSVGAASPTASMTTPTMQAPQFDIAKDILNIVQAKKEASETDYQELNNSQLKEMVEIGCNSFEQMWRMNEAKVSETLASEHELTSRATVNEATKNLTEIQIKQGRAATAKMQAELEATQYNTEWLKKSESQRLAEIDANIQALKAQRKAALSQADLNEANAAAANAMKKLTDQQIYGLALANSLKKYGVTDNSPMMTRLVAQVYSGNLSIGDALQYMDGVAQSLVKTHQLANQYDLQNESHYIWNTGEDMVRQLQGSLSIINADPKGFGMGFVGEALLNGKGSEQLSGITEYTPNASTETEDGWTTQGNRQYDWLKPIRFHTRTAKKTSARRASNAH